MLCCLSCVSCKALLVSVALVALFTAADVRNIAARLADAHFKPNGLRLPTRDFTVALRAAALDISHLSCRKSLVIMGMANEAALDYTVPLFLQSLSRVRMSGERNSGRTLDAGLVLVAWSSTALDMCRSLQAVYRHQCVHDAEHRATNASFAFHDVSFNALGFAKIKYILNGLSLGHDVFFLDTDVVVVADPLPYLLTRGSDLGASMERCAVVNDTMAFSDPAFWATGQHIPALNIGALYFKASAGVARCVYNWVWDMYQQVGYRSMVWDQDIYGIIMAKCAGPNGLRWQAFDPRLFQSACYPGCGCAFPDSAIALRSSLFNTSLDSAGNASLEEPFLPNNTCGPQHWSRWLLRHFPCSGGTPDKARLMGNLLYGMSADTTSLISIRGL